MPGCSTLRSFELIRDRERRRLRAQW